MSLKIGRNDPCSCGSGIKYKKCCQDKERLTGADDTPGTETLVDDYFSVSRKIIDYGQALMTFGENKATLRKAFHDFETRYKPGSADGPPSSLFMTWCFFDYRYGADQATVAERFLADARLTSLSPDERDLARRLADSYCAHYQIKKVGPDRLGLLELGTGKSWQAHRINEPFERDAMEGDVWYLRLVGPSNDAYIFTPPYIHPQSSKKAMARMVKSMTKMFEKMPKHLSVAADGSFKNACKAATVFWVGMLHKKPEEPFAPAPGIAGLSPKPGTPEMVNSDNHPLALTHVQFKIIKEDGLRARLSSLSALQYDESQKAWIWLRRRGKDKVLGRTVLGKVTAEEGRVQLETNSLERALDFREKLAPKLEKFIRYENLESKDFESLPPPSEDEMQKFEKEQAEINSRPEMRELLRKKMEDYYHKEWIKTKIPALGNKTPLEACQTEKGRLALEALLESFEERQKQYPENPAQIDFRRLKRELGL